ncbi:hypothetical protein L195_g008580 [Trifolium pratense]|uniref:BHLH domain-containing protein n=1 Tax=Trifolium pratense TaxID=57577 RepID=A0A2K3P9K1_TRIPR|nr:hypothetical protein L195_g008580 [Trifolium pratense]
MCQEEDYLGDYMVHQLSLEAPAMAGAATENTLQEICHIPTVVSSEMTKQLPHPSTSSKTCTVSFDNSAVIPLKPSVISSKPPRPPCSAKKRTSEKLKSTEAKAITKEGEKKIMVERKRRLELAHMFIELSATIPRLKKVLDSEVSSSSHTTVLGGSTSVLPFGSSTLAITIIAKMDDAYKMKMVDLVDNIRQLLSNGSANHPT